MRTLYKLLRITLPVVILGFLLSTARTVQAQGAGPSKLLRDAYVTLAQADHDYKGHRAAAMKHIEAAGKPLGVNVRGDGRGHEHQGVSDEQLRIARGMLEQARGQLKGTSLKHVNKAIQEINVALKIR